MGWVESRGLSGDQRGEEVVTEGLKGCLSFFLPEACRSGVAAAAALAQARQEDADFLCSIVSLPYDNEHFSSTHASAPS